LYAFRKIQENQVGLKLIENWWYYVETVMI
jgi:hypothetical protein